MLFLKQNFLYFILMTSLAIVLLCLVNHFFNGSIFFWLLYFWMSILGLSNRLFSDSDSCCFNWLTWWFLYLFFFFFVVCFVYLDIRLRRLHLFRLINTNFTQIWWIFFLHLSIFMGIILFSWVYICNSWSKILFCRPN